ncbi:MAG: tail protein X [Proteobacteria bacterium]|nr:tail protein X [Pseudomonadota bacterium]MBR2307868.1 tail protein X [Fibrobacter sp.]
MKYTAVHGDTWDSIAYKTYGDEFLCDEICKANARQYEGVVMFDGGEIVEVPESLSPKTEIIKAPWS